MRVLPVSTLQDANFLKIMEQRYQEHPHDINLEPGDVREVYAEAMVVSEPFRRACATHQEASRKLAAEQARLKEIEDKQAEEERAQREQELRRKQDEELRIQQQARVQQEHAATQALEIQAALVHQASENLMREQKESAMSNGSSEAEPRPEELRSEEPRPETEPRQEKETAANGDGPESRERFAFQEPLVAAWSQKERGLPLAGVAPLPAEPPHALGLQLPAPAQLQPPPPLLAQLQPPRLQGLGRRRRRWRTLRSFSNRNSRQLKLQPVLLKYQASHQMHWLLSEHGCQIFSQMHVLRLRSVHLYHLHASAMMQY